MTRKVVLGSFFRSETSKKIRKSTFHVIISVWNIINVLYLCKRFSSSFSTSCRKYIFALDEEPQKSDGQKPKKVGVISSFSNPGRDQITIFITRISI